jgi:hypothetical protein
MIPLTVPEIGRLLARPRPAPPGTGWIGVAAIKHAQPGITSALGSPATPRSPWSGSLPTMDR